MEDIIMKDNKLVIAAKETGLEQNKINNLLLEFAEPFKLASELSEGVTSLIVTDEDQRMLMMEARDKRLELKNIRIAVEKTRKSLKEQSLREGKAIDGMANIIKAIIVPAEEHLETQEKFAELKEKARKEERYTERLKKMNQFIEANVIEDLDAYNLMDMTDEVFESTVKTLNELQASKKAEADKIAKEQLAAEEAEKKRVAKIEKENAKLKKESESKEKAIAAERAKALEGAKKMQAELDAVEEAEKQRIASEKKAEADKAEAVKKAASAPDKEKLLNLANQIDTLVSKSDRVSTSAAVALAIETEGYLKRIAKNLEQKANQL